MLEQIANIQVAGAQGLGPFQVVDAALHVLVAIGNQHQSLCAARDAVQNFRHLLGARRIQRQAIDKDKLLVAGQSAQGAANGRAPHLLRHVLAVIARARTHRATAADKLRRAAGTMTRTPGPFLAIHLGRRRLQIQTALNLVRAQPRVGHLPDKRLVHQPDVDLGFENIGGQINRLNLLAGHIQYWYLHGDYLVPSCHLPRRTRAGLIMTMLPFAPGTEPRPASRLRSGSTTSACRFWEVTRSFPIRPAMRWPGSVRPGVVVAPTEPGARSRSD